MHSAWCLTHTEVFPSFTQENRRCRRQTSYLFFDSAQNAAVHPHCKQIQMTSINTAGSTHLGGGSPSARLGPSLPCKTLRTIRPHMIQHSHDELLDTVHISSTLGSHSCTGFCTINDPNTLTLQRRHPDTLVAGATHVDLQDG